MSDWRAEVAEFYDLAPHHPGDLPFYLGQISPGVRSVLELGCGTGRVTLPLAAEVESVLGLDNSEAMIAVCRDKLAAANISTATADAVVADITDFDVGRRFDLIIAPFRVIQNLATNAEVDGLFRCIHNHLAPDGLCVLNVFNPNRDRTRMIAEWVADEEELVWEVPDGDTVVRSYDRRRALEEDPLVLFPDLIYRRFRGNELLTEALLQIAMRCYYPQEFVALIESNGFEVVGRWGGYADEIYGEGPELVVSFRHPRDGA